MNFCLSYNYNNLDTLYEADEIYIQTDDIKLIEQILKNFNQQKIVCETNNQDILFNFQYDMTFIFNIIQKYNYQSFFFKKPCKTLEEVISFYDLGANQVIVDLPLTHNLSELKILNFQVRYNPIYCFLDNIPRQNGIFGNWILPQNLMDYEGYIDTIFFNTQNESYLFDLYKNKKTYNGLLNQLFIDFNLPIDSSNINLEKLLKRIDCKLLCRNPNFYCSKCV